MHLSKIFLLFFFLLLNVWSSKSYSQQIAPFAYGQSSMINYVRTWDAIKPDTNFNNFSTQSGVQQSIMTTQYLDGLGRSIQTVVKQGSLVSSSGTNVDLVIPQVYD